MAKLIKVPHYLFESQHSVTGSRVDNLAIRHNNLTVEISLPVWRSPGQYETNNYYLNVDERDQRVLIVVDGGLLPDSISRNADPCLLEAGPKLVREVDPLAVLSTPLDRIRSPRLDLNPPYKFLGENGRTLATLEISRLFLLVPVGNFFFWRPRDMKSLALMYVFAEVKRDKRTGNPEVAWHNSSY